MYWKRMWERQKRERVWDRNLALTAKNENNPDEINKIISYIKFAS